jgi:hypothetical protein
MKRYGRENGFGRAGLRPVGGPRFLAAGAALALVLGLAPLVLAGNVLASLPAAVAARTRPGVSLRTE